MVCMHACMHTATVLLPAHCSSFTHHASLPVCTFCLRCLRVWMPFRDAVLRWRQRCGACLQAIYST
jgi:hypothetical protein